MIFEHFALNVSQPVEMAEWYIENCGMHIVRSMDEPPYTRFLADQSGRVVFEVYSNPNADIPDHRKHHPLEFHFALMVEDAVSVRDQLIAAGAELFEDQKLEDGSHLVMLRDPFGVPLQLCQRANPMM